MFFGLFMTPYDLWLVHFAVFQVSSTSLFILYKNIDPCTRHHLWLINSWTTKHYCKIEFLSISMKSIDWAIGFELNMTRDDDSSFDSFHFLLLNNILISVTYSVLQTTLKLPLICSIQINSEPFIFLFKRQQIRLREKRIVFLIEWILSLYFYFPSSLLPFSHTNALHFFP